MNRKEALKIYSSGKQAVVQALLDQGKQIIALTDKVRKRDETIANLSKNSSNSSKRPSSDDITKPKKKNKAKRKRKIGGQPGHPKHERPLFPQEVVDIFDDCILSKCPDCDTTVLPANLDPRITQQVELNKNLFEIYEHRCHAYWCPKCQKIHYAALPPSLARQGLFKPRITATVAYMCHVCHASFSTMRKFFRDIIGINISRGYLSKIIQKVSMALEGSYQELLDRLPLETNVNVDETGHKENGDKFWTWVFKAELYVLFKIDKSRGSKVLIDVIGKEFDGVLGCDYFSAYRKYLKDFNATIQFCIAHLIREIKFLAGYPDEETKAYGQQLLESVKVMFKVIHARENMTPESFQKALEEAKNEIVRIGIEEAPSFLDENGKEQKNKAQNMANRFRNHGKQYFTFITSPGVEPTNNAAEQAIRFIVIDRHITQGTRSIKGRKANERLWTVIATCELQGRSAFDFIHTAVQAYFNGLPSPSLLPDTA